MKVQSLINTLNEHQREAVTAPPGNLLILAGAGSGKTRVLTHRIAWLIDHERASPYSILAVTFTNKAAHEMRGRIEHLVNTPMHAMWVGTFHGLAHRMLRSHWEKAKLPQDFQIMDTDDQHRMLKRIHQSMNLDEDKWQPKQSQYFINKQKDTGLRAKDVTAAGDFYTETMLRVYQAYEALCQRNGLVDFGELLLRSLELLKNNNEIRSHYQHRFKHILVDEFQDTNTIQYAWLRMLAGPDAYMIAVGDDDQSIYSWRGAEIENLHRFVKDLPNTTVIRLEQNYRSTQTILSAANAVIANNENRMGKELWSDGSEGELITLYTAFNEFDEAHYVGSKIKEWFRQGEAYRDIAILYRSNAQSRVLEEMLIDQQIPYRIYGGLKFFERAEIKDALAYLRLIANQNDDAAFERVVNTPTRGIGHASLDEMRTIARENSYSLWQAALIILDQKTLASRALNAIAGFINLINSMDTETTSFGLGEQCDHILHRSGVMALYKKDRSEKGLSKTENLEELINAMTQFKTEEGQEDMTPLSAFLSHVVLETGEAQSDANSDCVNLMTLHAAKGLEFPYVFITGMEEDLFPHKMSMNDPNGLEEERRLCYVGMTRAMKKLTLTSAETRRLYGMERFNNVSRFLHEIPEKLIDNVQPTARVQRTSHYAPSNQFSRSSSVMKGEDAGETGLHIGQRVTHKKFGKGTVINYEGSGAQTRIEVKFDDHGKKWLIASFANLT